MPEGFNSVKQLLIVVDANTEKMQAQVLSADKVLERFGNSTQQNLGKIDKTTGGFFGGLTGKLTGLVGMFGAAGLAYAAFMATAQQAAAAGGFSKEFEQANGALSDFLSTLAGVIPKALAAATALSSAGAAVTQAATQQETIWQKVVGFIQQAQREANGLAEAFVPLEQRTAGAVAIHIRNLREEIARTEAQSKSAFDPGVVDGYANRIRALTAEINKYTDAAAEAARHSGFPTGKDPFVDVMVDGANRLRDQQRTNAKLKMEGPEQARYDYIQESLDQLQKNTPVGWQPTEAQIAAIHKVGDEIRAAAQAEKDFNDAKSEKEKKEEQEKITNRIFIQTDREIAQLKNKADRYFMAARAADELNMREQLMLQLQQRGIPATEKELDLINKKAAAYADAQQKLRDLERQMQPILDFGNTISSGLADAFSKWTQGAKVDVKEMVASMLAEMAKLALMRNVLGPLFGDSFNPNGGVVGGFLSSFLYGGARAEGGPVKAGYHYTVGERGVEDFFAAQDGYIVPNGGGAVTVSMPLVINAQGAYPESIADIKREVAGLRASVPQQAVAAVREAQSRKVL